MTAFKSLFFFSATLLILFAGRSVSQTRRIVTGLVTDTASRAVQGAHVQLITGKDTLTAGTDEKGKFRVKGEIAQTAGILVRSIGYAAYSSELSFEERQSEIALGPIVLKADVRMLNEVVIKGTVNPVKLMQDTIEYNAAAYKIREGDYVEDLLRQLPGLEVDEKGQVTTMGKPLTKLRVNGKDFFTGDVKEFIRKLPAEIFSQLQVIDDYGDEANFTGIKITEPRKILNLITKPGRDKGRFGSVSAGSGTNNSHRLDANGNSWNGGKQLGFGGYFSNTRNSATLSHGNGANVNFRNQLSKKWGGNMGYSFSGGDNTGSNSSDSQVINPAGIIYSNSQSTSGSDNTNHNFNAHLEGNIPGMFIRGSLSAGLSRSGGDNNSSLLQTGILRQDIYTLSKSASSNPSISTDFSIGSKFAKPGRSLMITGSFNRSGSAGNEDILTDIDYYDMQTNMLLKDSLLNRLVETENNNNSFRAGFTYSEPFNNPKDTIYRGIDVSYSFSLTSTSNRLQTNVRENDKEIRFIDSLSNVYTSVFMDQNLRAGYRYSRKKINYNLGMAISPAILKGSYEGRMDKIKQTTVNTAPSANFNYQFSTAQSLGINYGGNSMAPNFNQLQPVPDTRDLRNVIIGNPDLKTSFMHHAGMNYRLFNARSGRALQLSVNASTVRNQVVSDVSLIKDTLNSLKQETRFKNVNGNYNTGGYYNLSVPFSKRKYSFSINGGFNYSNSVLFTNNIKNRNRRWNYNQSTSFGMNGKWLTVSSSASYNYSGNNYTITSSLPNVIQTLSFNTNSSVRFKNMFFGGLDISKSFNRGYSQGSNNPLMVNAHMNASFLKKQMLRLSVNASDILNQGNNLYRTVNDNTITDIRPKQVTRYVMLNLSLNIEQFK